MLRHMLFQHRGKSRMHAVLLGLWLGCFLSVLPLKAAQLWEECSGAATGEQPVPPAFVELAKHLKPAVVNISSKQTEGKSAPRRSPFGREENDPFQEFFDRFFEAVVARGASVQASVQVSSLTRPGSLSRTIMWWREPQKLK